jgi:DNA repair exonuclease SbcCD ATPase subunit
MTLIEGKNLDDESANSNGAGKSSIVDALVWCLYGVTTHDSCEGDDVVNEKRGVNCEVKVCFADDDSQVHWEVTRRRAWNRGGKKVQLNLKFVTRDDERAWTKGTIRDTQAEIVRALGMSAATFRHACIFGHGRAYRFSRLTDSEKKSVLDEMLGSEIYAKASQKAGDQLLEVDRELDKLKTQLETRLESLQDAKQRRTSLRRKAQGAERVAKQERKSVKREIAALEAKLKVEQPKVSQVKQHWQTARDNARAALDARSAAQQAVTRAQELDRSLAHERTRIAKLEVTTCVTCK